MTRISTREYAAIAPSISEEGVRVNGAVIALDPDNSAAVAGAVKALLEQAPASEAATPHITFDAALQRFRAAAGWGVAIRLG